MQNTLHRSSSGNARARLRWQGGRLRAVASSALFAIVYGGVGHTQSISLSIPCVIPEAITKERIQTMNVHILMPNLARGSHKLMSNFVGGFLAASHSLSLSALSLKAGIFLPSLFVTSMGIINPLCSRIVKMFQAIVSGKLSVSGALLWPVKSCHSQYCGSFRCSQIQFAALANS